MHDRSIVDRSMLRYTVAHRADTGPNVSTPDQIARAISLLPPRVRLDQQRRGGQPERGKQEAGEEVGRVVLAPVQAGKGQGDPPGGRRGKGKPAPPAPPRAGGPGREG